MGEDPQPRLLVLMTTEAQIIVSPIENLVFKNHKSLARTLNVRKTAWRPNISPNAEGTNTEGSCCSDIQEGNAEVLLQCTLLVISDLMLQLAWLTLPLKTGCNGALCHGGDLFELSRFQN